jgi:CheY-like chemotaxis protein/two-component sensor histidine kinase
VILDAAERAAALTRQLLAFSRKQIMRMEPVDLNGVVTGMDKMLRRVIGEDIALRVDLAPDLHVVRADRSQLEQIVMNLAVNARDAMPTGGALTIETRNEDLDEQFTEAHYGTKVGPHVRLAVSDTGIGMDETTRARIFEPFFTTKASGSGTGLGLSTVFGIVQQMGGSVWAYSEPGKGTLFKIHLPAHPDLPAELPPEAKADPRQMRGTETILVVEDDDRVRTATQRILEDSGYRVLPAPHGAAALEILRAEAGRIDLVLSDVVMPGMSASELLGAIRDTAQIPILFMSGYTDNSIVNHGILEGELPFIHKPFSLRSLLLKIREVLDQGDARGAGSPRLSRDPSRER